MAALQYKVLLNESLKEHILTLSEKEKRRVREKFEFLENGIWDAGARVKKLRSVPGKLVFEARISKGDRIIFTLGRDNGTALIYVWGLVKHDDVSKKARSIFPENAGFLGFEEESSEDIGELSIDNLDQAYFTQESIEEKAKADYGPQKWLVLSDNEWKRILKKPDPDNFEMHLYLTGEQADILACEPPVLLSGTAGSGKTTLAVYYLFRNEFRNAKRLFLTCSSYLKIFSRKIYDGLVAKTETEKEENPPSFLTFAELLNDISATGKRVFASEKCSRLREFEDIFKSHKLCSQYDAELVWEEIRAIIKGAKSPVSVKRFEILAKGFAARSLGRKAFVELKDSLCDLENFEFMKKIENVLAKKTSFASFEDFLLRLDEAYAKSDRGALFLVSSILDIIGKHVGDFASPLLSLDEYLMLGKKRAPHFVYDRKEIYSIAEFYQSKLEEFGAYDEIDLTRHCLGLVESSPERFSYDFVVCDEVQDFSDVQVSLVFRLCAEDKGIVFAGDPKQIINPSGFRWEEVRRKFYERGTTIPAIKNLSLNFRCVGNIVRLANSLLDLKQKLVGLSGSELREDWKFSGKPPLVAYGIDEEALLREISESGSGRIVIVRTKEERDRLKKKLGTELVFTINDAKGLEFDTVLLWKFSGNLRSRNLWRKIAKGDFLDPRHEPHIKHEISLLYVAITRARNTLVIYDGDEYSDIWNIATLTDHVHIANDKAILTRILARISSPREWEKQGDYFFSREYYPAAYECFMNSGNIGKTELSLAFVLESGKEYSRAAELFEKHGSLAKAAECYEQSNDYEHAEPLWKKLGEKIRAKECTIFVLERNGDFGTAGDEWEKLKEMERAAVDWEKAGNHEKLGAYLYKAKQFEKASIAFERAKMFDKAAMCANKLKNFDKAADFFFMAGDYENAAVLYRRLKRNDRLMACYLKLNDFKEIGELAKKAGDYSGAIRNYKLFAEKSEENARTLGREAKDFLKEGDSLEAALRYSALGKNREAGIQFMNLEMWEPALAEFKRIGDHELISNCYLELDKLYESALEIEKSDVPHKWQIAEERLSEYVSIRDGRNHKFNDVRAKSVFDEAERFEKSGRIEGALARYKALNYTKGVYSLCLAHEKDDEAMEFFFELDEITEARNYILERKTPSISRKRLTKIAKQFEHNSDFEAGDSWRIFEQMCGFFNTYLDLCHEENGTINILYKQLGKIVIPYENVRYHEKEYLTLIVRVRSYARILHVIQASLKRKQGIDLDHLYSECRKYGEADNDANLIACCYWEKDQVIYEEMIASLEVTEKNTVLFAKSPKHYRKLVEYFSVHEEYEKAEAIAEKHNDMYAVARLLIKEKSYKEAALVYEKLEEYDKAIECHKNDNNLPAVAKIYEKTKQYEKALGIWQSLRRIRDVRRVEKLVQQPKQQMELPFE